MGSQLIVSLVDSQLIVNSIVDTVELNLKSR